MTKYFKSYIGLWAVLFVLFNVIAFVSPGWIAYEKYTPSFWIGYVVIILAFIGQLVCSKIALSETNSQKLFYNLPLVTVSYTGLILICIVGGACMLLSPLPYWIAGLVCSAILLLNIMPVIKTSMAIEAVTEIDQKIADKTLFIKSLTVDAESLMRSNQNNELKDVYKKIYEAVRYSDPVSSDAVITVENDIRTKFNELKANSDDSALAKSLANELLNLLEERNKKCKLSK